MKKCLILLLVIIFVASMTVVGIGCKEEAAVESASEEIMEKESTEEAVEEETTKETETVTITWLTSPQPNTTAGKSFISEFEKETGIKVVVDEMDEVRMLEKLALDKTAGTNLYDIVSIESTWIEKFIKDEIIFPIDDLMMDQSLPVPGLDLDDYSPAAVTAQTERYGKKWMVLYGAGTSFLAVRKDWLEEEGLDAPETWEDVLNVASTFTKEDRYGMSLRGQRGIHAVFSYYCIAHTFGLKFLDEDKNPLMNSKEALDGLNMYLELAKFAPPDMPAWTHEEAITAFVEGVTGQVIDVSQLIPWIEGELPGQVVYIPVPQVPGQDPAAVLSGWGIGIHADSTHKEEAIKFIEYITAKRNAKKFVEVGGSPERMSILTDATLAEENPYYNYQIESYKIAKFAWPEIISIPEWNDILGKYVNEALTGTLSPEDALEQANKELSELMEREKS